jgi:hypothetical protein
VEGVNPGVCSGVDGIMQVCDCEFCAVLDVVPCYGRLHLQSWKTHAALVVFAGGGGSSMCGLGESIGLGESVSCTIRVVYHGESMAHQIKNSHGFCSTPANKTLLTIDLSGNEPHRLSSTCRKLAQCKDGWEIAPTGWRYGRRSGGGDCQALLLSQANVRVGAG